MEMRLEKLVADAFGASRSAARAMIKSGRVAVAGAICTAPDSKLPPDAAVTLDGEPLEFKRSYYIMMNKPAGVLSATEDASMKTALDLLPEKLVRLGLFPAGRLDRDSEGLLLLTNDGGFCHNVISPKKDVKKLYLIETDAPMTASDIAVFRAGAPMGGGETARPALLEPLDGSRALVTVSEGRFHQVKRMARGVGKTVLYLKRLRIGGLELDQSLEPGEYRELTEGEMKSVLGEK